MTISDSDRDLRRTWTESQLQSSLASFKFASVPGGDSRARADWESRVPALNGGARRRALSLSGGRGLDETWARARRAPATRI
jgi:hypothetical protein